MGVKMQKRLPRIDADVLPHYFSQLRCESILTAKLRNHNATGDRNLTAI